MERMGLSFFFPFFPSTPAHHSSSDCPPVKALDPPSGRLSFSPSAMDDTYSAKSPSVGLLLSNLPREVWECLLSYLELGPVAYLLFTGNIALKRCICLSQFAARLQYDMSMPLKWPTILSSFSALSEVTLVPTEGQYNLDYRGLAQLSPSVRTLRLLVIKRNSEAPFVAPSPDRIYSALDVDISLPEAFPNLSTLEMPALSEYVDQTTLLYSISGLNHLTSLSLYYLEPNQLETLPHSLLHLKVDVIYFNLEELVLPPSLETFQVSITPTPAILLPDLPRTLKKLVIRTNFRDALPILCTLPEGLTHLDIKSTHLDAEEPAPLGLSFPPQLKYLSVSSPLHVEVIKLLPRSLETLLYSRKDFIPWSCLPPNLTTCPDHRNSTLPPFAQLPRSLTSIQNGALGTLKIHPAICLSEGGQISQDLPKTLKYLEIVINMSEAISSDFNGLLTTFPENSLPISVTNLRLTLASDICVSPKLAEDLISLINERLPNVIEIRNHVAALTNAMSRCTLHLKTHYFHEGIQSDQILSFTEAMEGLASKETFSNSPVDTQPSSNTHTLLRWCKDLERLGLGGPSAAMSDNWLATAPQSLTELVFFKRPSCHIPSSILSFLPPRLTRLKIPNLTGMATGCLRAIPRSLTDLTLTCPAASAHYTWPEFLALPLKLATLIITRSLDEDGRMEAEANFLKKRTFCTLKFESRDNTID